MIRQFYFLIDKEKEKLFFDQIENRFNCKFCSYFVSEKTDIQNDIFLIVSFKYEKYIKYIDADDNVKGRKIYPFDESLNMISAIEYSREETAYSDNMLLCRIYLSSNIRNEDKKNLKSMFKQLYRLIKKHSEKIRIDGIRVYYLNGSF